MVRSGGVIPCFIFNMKKKDHIIKKIKVPKGYRPSEIVGDNDSTVIVFEKKKGDKNEKTKVKKNRM